MKNLFIFLFFLISFCSTNIFAMEPERQHQQGQDDDVEMRIEEGFTGEEGGVLARLKRLFSRKKAGQELVDVVDNGDGECAIVFSGVFPAVDGKL